MNRFHNREKLFFPNLDGLRTIAFFMVFSEHVFWSAFKYLEIKSPILLHSLYTIFGNGGIGVSIFFVLSGFLITYLILKEQEGNGRLDVKAFYIRRSLRIWPLYFILLLFIFFIYPFILNKFNLPVFENPAETWKYFAFLSNFDMIKIHESGKEAFMHSGVTWSIAIEEQFYFIWPLLFFFISRKFQPLIFSSFILLTFIFRFLHYFDPTVLYFHSLGVCSDLALGGLAAYISLTYTSQLLKWLPTNNFTRFLIYSIGISFVILNEFLITWSLWPVFGRFTNTLFFTYIILDQNFSVTNFFKFSRFKLITQLGKYTYGLYLLHPIGYMLVKFPCDFLDITTTSFFSRFLFSIVVLLFTILLSLLSYHFLERPFLVLKNRFSYISKE